MKTKKRERSVNFTAAEIQVLIKLAEKYKHIIENKKTDAVTNKNKKITWKRIENYFNACGISSNIRTWKTLKFKYKGIKDSAKKKSSEQRQQTYRTGGGPSKAPDFNNIEEKVLSICSKIQGLDGSHDCDTIITPDDEVLFVTCDKNEQNQETKKDFDLDESIIVPDMKEDQDVQKDSDDSVILNMNIEDKDKEESQKENKWDRWHSKALKSRVSSVSKEKVTKGSVTTEFDELSSSRLELVHLQIEIAKRKLELVEEEQKLKIQHLANDERRKEEIHALLVQRLKCGPITNDILKY